MVRRQQLLCKSQKSTDCIPILIHSPIPNNSNSNSPSLSPSNSNSKKSRMEINTILAKLGEAILNGYFIQLRYYSFLILNTRKSKLATTTCRIKLPKKADQKSTQRRMISRRKKSGRTGLLRSQTAAALGMRLLMLHRWRSRWSRGFCC